MASSVAESVLSAGEEASSLTVACALAVSGAFEDDEKEAEVGTAEVGAGTEGTEDTVGDDERGVAGELGAVAAE